ncbi:helix-turn-helix domain-containing protein [Methylobacterium nigriterrae]|uniref:helix-turn-helix domain-containing protein n=1 Tax=Methylobacterium nigriterrae TaxID=3127512 RepID=UPI003013D290
MTNGELQFRIGRAKRIEQALVGKKWTRIHLAKLTGYDERTIRNILSGKPVRDQTIVDVCQALGIEPELEQDHHIEIAEEQFGAYARAPFRAYEGAFFAYRRSFSVPSRLLRTVIEFAWSREKACLTFQEHSRYASARKLVNNSQGGCVHISPLTDLIHLVTSWQGAVRLITLTKMRGGEPVMRGAVLTQSEHRMFYQPSISPMVLIKIEDYEPEQHRAMVGQIDASAEEYEMVCEELEQTEREVVQLATAPSRELA